MHAKGSFFLVQIADEFYIDIWLPYITLWWTMQCLHSAHIWQYYTSLI